MIFERVFLVAFLSIHLSSQQECQSGVYSGIREARDTVAPVAYNGIEPDTTGCVVRAEGTFFECEAGEEC
ncbi:hypothetical protein GBAR_LOCUS28115 [Geodia barretti]|uniref:Uncharacterized protein n=1 Tax=Geodia barretti TaxID=519541 RepID=A0AA35XBH2_GEOBA|nr:hypothetical protein GBAR_LOCUS28115 [Geodia barretti]